MFDTRTTLLDQRDAMRHRLAELGIERKILRRLLRVADDAWLEARRLQSAAPRGQHETAGAQQGVGP
jgi:hypothetical protein